MIEEQHVYAGPPSVTIQPLPGRRTTAVAPLFTFQAVGAAGVPVRDVYYQLDTWTGPWRRAAPAGEAGQWQGYLAGPTQGTHILYAFAVDGQEATSANAGDGGSPAIGSITAYLFVNEGTWLHTYLPTVPR